MYLHPSRSRRALVPAGLLLAAALAACTTDPLVTGSVRLDVLGLPDGTVVEVAVTDADGSSRTVQAPGTLAGLLPGVYTVEGAPVTLANEGFPGEETFDAAGLQVIVAADATAEVELEYEVVAGRFADPEGDAFVDGPFAYDIVETGYRVVGETIEVWVTFADGQTDLSRLLAYFQLDTDHDPETGWAGAYGEYCTGAVGADFELAYEFGATSLYGEVFDGDPYVTLDPPVQDGTTLTFTVPRDLLVGASRMNLAVVLGNPDEPTDCDPY